MPLDLAHAGNADQIAYWNGPSGRRWTARQDMQDAVFAPISDRLYARAHFAPGQSVIDVGCGCGATTLDIARRIAPNGSAIGVDVSEPMIGRARERAPADGGPEFLLADATTYDFAPEAADLLFSRFGVMFFADPVLAFANMRKGLKRGGRVAFACWREPKLNPWQTVSLKAACKHVPRLPDAAPDAPGPFSFADPVRLHGILEAAGYDRIALTPIDIDLDLAAGRGFEAGFTTALEVGAASRAMDGQPEASRAAAAEEIRAALAPYQRGPSLPLGAAIWIVEAVNP